MTFRTGFAMAMLAAFLVAGTGCANKTNAELDGLRSQNEDFKKRLDAETARANAAEQRAAMVTSQNTSPTPETVGTPGMDATGGAGGGLVDLSNGGRGVSPRPGAGRTTPPPNAGAGTTSRVNAAGEVAIEISGDVLFDSGQIKLKPAAEKTLDEIAAQIKKSYAGRTLRIEGHTDPTPVKSTAKGYSNNYELGLARANAVMQYLAKKGIPAKSMSAKSFGATDPKSATNLAMDRRVDIIVAK